MALNSVNRLIQTAITSVNADNGAYCGYLLAMRGRTDTYIQKTQSQLPLPCLVQYIEYKEETIRNGERLREIEFYMFGSIEKKDNNPEAVEEVHEIIDNAIYEFYRNLQGAGFRPALIGKRERLVEQIAAVYDAGIFFTLTLTLDAKC
jgi:hypothetical protein